ncbi:hypothetical protein [Leifsonia poae]|uniref:hypothetical protein n=1 Tax=Leifsonia poae TaxID=110933 RepID=UPI003D66764E
MLTAVMVLVAMTFGVFFGTIVAILWLAYGIVATGFALVSLSSARPWMGAARPMARRRMFLILLGTWFAAWGITGVLYSTVALILTPASSLGYALGVLGSVALASAPFLVVYAITSAVQLALLTPRRAVRGQVD